MAVKTEEGVDEKNNVAMIEKRVNSNSKNGAIFHNIFSVLLNDENTKKSVILRWVGKLCEKALLIYSKNAINSPDFRKMVLG
ncbi:hypothetical protein [Acinetobacter oleivorans]|uniref:hypothetical protein n=1 Tax=Acinetobacter oleivorans TaxID=1148157 RepID=UPI001783B9B1|nr:hypothetical protein [Acinetobacter oleivorans]